MIQLLELPEAELQVVDALTMTDLSRHGWSLIALLEVDDTKDIETFVEDIELQKKFAENDRYQGFKPITYKKKVQFKESRFLMRRLKESALGPLTEELDKSRAELSMAQRESERLKDTVERLLKTSVEADVKLKKEQDAYRSMADMASTAQKRERKLEGDIAKLRRSLGDLRMKEILESV
jgi:hypothetical protein